MKYKEIVPSPPLSCYIKCFWILEDDYSTSKVPELVLPDGCMELIFHFADPFILHDAENINSQPKAFLFGQLTQSIQLGSNGRTGIIAARFKPYGARPFLEYPLNEITNQVIASENLFGVEGKILEEEIVNARSNDERLQVLQRFLIIKLENFERNDNMISDCVNKISKSNGMVKIDELSQHYQISQRQLERRFSSAVGLSPKYYGRICRFQNIFKLANKMSFSNFTELTYASGYYDQAHFIKDFRHFTGISPKKYFQENHPIAKLFL